MKRKLTLTELLEEHKAELEDISKEELVNFLVKFFLKEGIRNKKLDLTGLDFTPYDCDVGLSRMKVARALDQSFQEVGGDLFQSNQTVSGYLFQLKQIVRGDLYQSRQVVDGMLDQAEQKVKGDLYQLRQEVEGDLYQSRHKVKGSIIR